MPTSLTKNPDITRRPSRDMLSLAKRTVMMVKANVATLIIGRRTNIGSMKTTMRPKSLLMGRSRRINRLRVRMTKLRVLIP